MAATTGSGNDLKVGFIGAGKMSRALIRGMLKSGKVQSYNVYTSARTKETGDANRALGVQVCENNTMVAENSDVIFLGVKPYQIIDIIKEVNYVINNEKIIASIAAGTKLVSMQKALKDGTRLLRVMPNLPVEIGQGTCAITAGKEAQSGDDHLVASLLSGSGYVEIMTEENLEICSSVLATMYGSVVIEAMADGCVKMGMPRSLAIRVSAQSILGAGHLVLETGKHPGVIKDEVCSPGGTTIAALHHLEDNAFRGALIGAIEVQTNKSREMGKEFE